MIDASKSQEWIGLDNLSTNINVIKSNLRNDFNNINSKM
jgi:hypothetical protein